MGAMSGFYSPSSINIAPKHFSFMMLKLWDRQAKEDTTVLDWILVSDNNFTHDIFSDDYITNIFRTSPPQSELHTTFFKPRSHCAELELSVIELLRVPVKRFVQHFFTFCWDQVTCVWHILDTIIITPLLSHRYHHTGIITLVSSHWYYHTIIITPVLSHRYHDKMQTA